MDAHTRLFDFLIRWWLLTLLLMGLSFVLFGMVTVNLLHLLGANFEFLSRHGWDAIKDGGLWQLVGLLASGYAAAVCYIVFKLCEKALVERLAIDQLKGHHS